MIDKLRRVTPAPLIMRALVFATGFAALWSAAPGAVLSPRFLFFIGVLSLVPAFAPGSRFVDVMMVLAVIFWVVATLGTGQTVTGPGTFTTACALYLLHSSAALAAVLPYDSIVDSAVILRWAARAALVIVVSAAVSTLIVLTVPSVTPGASVPVLLVGLGAAAGIVAVLSWAARLKKREL